MNRVRVYALQRINVHLVYPPTTVQYLQDSALAAWAVDVLHAFFRRQS